MRASLRALLSSDDRFRKALKRCIRAAGNTLYVLSLGGGPGPCLTGLKKFLKEEGFLRKPSGDRRCKLHGCVADACGTWRIAAAALGYGFVHMDVTELEVSDLKEDAMGIRSADIIIISYVLKVGPRGSSST